MKIWAKSCSRFYGGQIDRIEDGFVQFGHELADRIDEADIVYSNDEGGYKQILDNNQRGKVKGKIIFNVLDVPEHNITDYDLGNLDKMLGQAHAVTVISNFVQSQLIKYIKRESSVIYNPIKPVVFKPEERSDRYIRFLSVGRRSDQNKRFGLSVQALQILGINYGQLGLVGGEYASWGEYLGILKDEQLSRVYNTVDFVLATGKVEGLNLPVLESMSTGVIPVVCNDMTTRQELLPSSVFPEYDEVNPDPVSISKFIARFMQDNNTMNEMKDRLHKHYLANWADKVSGKGVAQAILDVYNKIKT